MRARLWLLLLVAGCGADRAPVAPRPVPSAPAAAVPATAVHDDDFLYLEDVAGERALAFARAHDAVSEKELTGDPGFAALEQKLHAIYGSKERIPFPRMAGDRVRNFWTDSDHPRGLWRETSLAEYRKPKPAWTTLLDVDALGKEEHESYVFHGATCLYPLRKRCLLALSPGGGDADVFREYDVDKKAFVKDGFVLPRAKSVVSWKDEDTLFIGTDLGPGTLTTSGYPRLAKEWKRGTPLSSATTVLEASASDVDVQCTRSFDHGRKRDVCIRGIDFDRDETFLLREGKLVLVDKQADAVAGLWDDELLLRLRSDWTVGTVTYRKGSLLAIALEPFLTGDRRFQTLFEPTASTSLTGWSGAKTRLFVNTLHDVRNEVLVFTRRPGDASQARWSSAKLDETAGAIGVTPVDPDRSDDAWLTVEDFTLPSSLALYDARAGKRELLKSTPTFFDATGLTVAQHFATSKDGTKIPYTEVAPRTRVGPVATLLEAYGGFEISLGPRYAATPGAAWATRGGVWVLANLRGGGEYGPAWHEAAIKRNRQRAYDDMAAVAEDLVKRGVTTPKQLGILGASNGGLLTSVMLTQRPELFGAVVSKVPLTDMRRFHELLAGASWMSEYGNPDDPGDWAALARYSPFQNVKRAMPYPPMFFTTSTKDDRVHPGHARKMVAKLEALGYAPLYYENIEGGHGGAADAKQTAHVDALVYTFLGSRLGLGR
ncbi:MAG: Prolyl endopeptidase [Labilithrix sp.]|nr:Prolyl endopeptidase [Labilithrix sp.]